MVEEHKETPETTPEPAKKGGLMKMLLLGVGFLVLTGVVSVGTVFILGTDEPVTSTEAGASDSTHSDPNGASGLPEISSDKKQDPMDNLMENLAILDYKPGPNELTTADGSMIIQDSIDAMTFITQEKERLAEWKKKLEQRQQEIDQMDKVVSAKLLKIEEVEIARVTKLAKLYDGMQATSVAQLMANLDDKTIVEVIPKMNAKQASAVLALLPPVRAAKISKQLMTIAEN